MQLRSAIIEWAIAPPMFARSKREFKHLLAGSSDWRHAFGDVTPVTNLAFAGSDSFTITGVPIARDAALFEAGLDVALTANASLGVAYQGQFASGSQQNGFDANLTVKF